MKQKKNSLPTGMLEHSTNSDTYLRIVGKYFLLLYITDCRFIKLATDRSKPLPGSCLWRADYTTAFCRHVANTGSGKPEVSKLPKCMYWKES